MGRGVVEYKAGVWHSLQLLIVLHVNQQMLGGYVLICSDHYGFICKSIFSISESRKP